MEKLHKMVNGEKIFLSEEEEKRIRAEWVENKAKAEIERQEMKAMQEKKRMLREKFASMMDITMEEFDLMMGK